VLLEVLVTEEGRVGGLRVAESSGHAALDKAALEAVEDWRFRPGRRGDRAAAMRVLVPVRFRLR
jgi:protein TonB